jgi:hypothetical protein
MNSDPQLNQVALQLTAFINDVIKPPESTSGFGRRVLLARQAAAVGGALATLVQVIVWLLLAVFGGHLDTPWWLWTPAAAATAVGLLTVVDLWNGGHRRNP